MVKIIRDKVGWFAQQIIEKFHKMIVRVTSWPSFVHQMVQNEYKQDGNARFLS